MKDLIKRIHEIDEALRNNTQRYYNTNPLFSVRDEDAKAQIPYDINDLFLLGALTNSDLLLAGTTGCGKSHLSRMAMNGLYGNQGFTNLTVTPGLNESDFLDVDVAGVKSGEKTLKQAIQSTDLLTRPGAIINEINRTPEILQNVFISYLERIFSLKGIEFPVGVAFKEGYNAPQDPHYQFRVISINEGADYAGTSGIDRAVRDRVVLEIPMDYFRPRKQDSRRMVRERDDSDLSIKQINGGKLEDILRVVGEVESIPVSLSAEEFLVYLQGLNNCVKSSTYSKKGINFKTTMCEGCHLAKDQVQDKGNICGSVYAPSDRSLINLKKIGRIVAALRAYKVIVAVSTGAVETKDTKDFVNNYLQGLQVTLDDITSVAPFVLTSKMIINPKWIDQEFQGSKFNATQHVVRTAREKLRNYVRSPVYSELIKSNGVITPEVRKQMQTYITHTDVWAYNIGDLTTQSYQSKNGNIDIGKLLT